MSEGTARVLTIAVNPSVDLAAPVDRVVAGPKLRCGPTSTEPGGGGINVARVVQRLHRPTKVIAALGGCTGETVADLVEAEGVSLQAVRIAADTRQSLTVAIDGTGEQYRFVLPGQPLSEAEEQVVLDAAVAAARPGDVVVASGSLPPGMRTDFYARLAVLLHGRVSQLVVDTAGAPLECSLDAPIDVIKPNVRELASLVGRELHSDRSILTAAREVLARSSVGAIVVSMGARGVLMVCRDGGPFFVPGHPVAEVSAVGAGDSTVAGLAVGLLDSKPLVEALELGVAAGAAAVMTPGSELCRVEDIDHLLGASSSMALGLP